MMLIGLTGERQVGKSALASHLVAHHGFARMHPFDGGKAASLAYFEHLGADTQTAMRMIVGDLKDTPSPFLPRDAEGNHFHPRYFLEKFGAFLGVEMGPAWTVDQEVSRLLRSGETHIVSESVVFEQDAFRKLGGVIIKVTMPGRSSRIRGVETDPVVNALVPDFNFVNAADSPEAAGLDFAEFLMEKGLLEEEDPFPELPEMA